MRLHQRRAAPMAICSWLVVLTGSAGAQTPALKLPAPSGPHPVGTNTFHIVDKTREELATPDPDDHRQLMMQVWYPALKDQGGRPAKYISRLDAFRPHLPPGAYEVLKGIQTNASFDAPADRSLGPYPIVLVSHGWSSFRSDYTILLEELASHGYIAIGIDHPYLGRTALPDGSLTTPSEDHFSSPAQRQQVYAGDEISVLNELTRLSTDERNGLDGMLDLERICAMGHSSGVGPALGGASIDERIDAAVAFDAFSNGGDAFVLRQPLLLVRCERAPKPTQSFVDRAGGALFDVHLPDTPHAYPSDGPWLNATLAGDADTVQACLKRSESMHRILMAFLESTLRGKGDALAQIVNASDAPIVVRKLR